MWKFLRFRTSATVRETCVRLSAAGCVESQKLRRKGRERERGMVHDMSPFLFSFLFFDVDLC